MLPLSRRPYLCHACALQSFRFVSLHFADAHTLFHVSKSSAFVIVRSDGLYPSFYLVIRHALRLFRSTAPQSVTYPFRVVIPSFYSLLHIVSPARLWNHTRFPCSVSFARFACLVCFTVAVWQPTGLLDDVDPLMRSDACVPIWIIQLRTLLRTEFWSEKVRFCL